MPAQKPGGLSIAGIVVAFVSSPLYEAHVERSRAVASMSEEGVTTHAQLRAWTRIEEMPVGAAERRGKKRISEAAQFT